MEKYIIMLIICSVAMSAFAVIFIALTPLLSKRYTAKSLYYAWLVIVIGFIIPFRFHLDTGLIKVDVPHPVVEHIVSGEEQMPDDKLIVTKAVPEKNLVNIVYQLAVWLWSIGTIAFIAINCMKHYRFIKTINRWSEEVTSQEMLNILQELRAELKISQQVKLKVCSSIASPMTTGFIHPVILLPATNYTADEQLFILKHELVHYKRKDLWYKALLFLATAIHWFNPIVYLMARAIEVQCEISCDEEVLKNIDFTKRLQYSETIIAAIKTQSSMRTAFSTNFYGGKETMKKRIFSIMDTTKKKIGIFILCFALAGTIGVEMVFAVNDSNNNNISIVKQEVITLSDSNDGTIKQSSDGGKTWTDYEPYNDEAEFEWYTYDEYKKWLDNTKIELQQLVETKAIGWTSSKGEFTWTQEIMDESIEMYEKILQEIKDGARVSKTKIIDQWVENKEDGERLFSSSLFSMTSSNADSQALIGAVIDGKDGENINIGPYETLEELLSAANEYLEDEVEAKRLSKTEASEIYQKVESEECVIRVGAATRLQAEKLYKQLTDK